MTARLIHVGLGGRGQHWLDFMRTRPDVTSVGYVDASQKIRDDVRARTGVAQELLFERLEEALPAVQADFALIATPSFLHASQAMQVLSAHLAVLVEKPLGLNLADATAVTRRAREVDRPVVVAENYRFFQAERTLRAFLESGVAGRIASAMCIDRRDQSSSSQGPWVKGMDHPFLAEIAVHHFDSFCYLFGTSPVSVFARSYNPPGSDYDHEGGAHALLEFDGGPTVQYTGTFVGSRYQYELWLETENGDVRTDRIRVWWRPRSQRRFQEVKPQTLPPGEALRYPRAGMATILDQFLGALQRGTPAETSGENNLWTLAMLEAAILSAREGRKVSITEVFPQKMQPVHASAGTGVSS
jgi:predicted dehydrogenase